MSDFSINYSELEAKRNNGLQARENVCDKDTVGIGLRFIGRERGGGGHFFKTQS